MRRKLPRILICGGSLENQQELVIQLARWIVAHPCKTMLRETFDIAYATALAEAANEAPK